MRRDLSGAETAGFIAAMASRLEPLRATMADGRIEVLRAEGDSPGLLRDLVATLTQILLQDEPLAPPIAAK